MQPRDASSRHGNLNKEGTQQTANGNVQAVHVDEAGLKTGHVSLVQAVFR